jgi:hypothetical protein
MHDVMEPRTAVHGISDSHSDDHVRRHSIECTFNVPAKVPPAHASRRDRARRQTADKHHPLIREGAG